MVDRKNVHTQIRIVRSSGCCGRGAFKELLDDGAGGVLRVSWYKVIITGQQRQPM